MTANFPKFDNDSSKGFSFKEFQPAFDAYVKKFEPEMNNYKKLDDKYTTMFEIDKDGNKEISLNEIYTFIAMEISDGKTHDPDNLKGKAKKQYEKEAWFARKVFKRVDKDGNGELNKSEFFKAFMLYKKKEFMS